MQSLTIVCLKVILDTHDNIESLLNLQLGTYMQIMILNALRVKNISRIIVDESTVESISSINKNKRDVYDKLMKYLRRMKKRGVNLKAYDTVRHVCDFNQRTYISYGAHLSHVFDFRTDKIIYTFTIQNPGARVVNHTKECTCFKNSRWDYTVIK